MRARLTVATAVVLCVQLSYTARLAAQAATPQCGDSTYLALLGKGVDALSAREYEVFRLRDDACIQSLRRLPPVAVATSPSCSDSLYQSLKRRSVDSLSQREYDLFRPRDQLCVESQQAAGLAAQPRDSVRQGARIDTVAVVSDASNLMAQGTADGHATAEGVSTGGWFGGGFASGVLLGLIGTGVIWAFAAGSDSEPTGALKASIADRSPVYQQGFNEAYRRKLSSKKKSSAVTGGLIGTAVFLVIYVASTSGSSY